jgi:23S rRNA (guanosine2251-2'-O)-methyltransferase
MIVISGRNPVIEALRAGTPLDRIVIQAGTTGQPVEDIRFLAGERGVRVIEADKERFLELGGGTSAQGVVAFAQPRSAATLEAIMLLSRERGERGFVLLLDEIEDPQNLGALIRTAECAGVHGVVIPRHRAVHVTAAVAKASAGATEHVMVVEVINLVTTIERLKEEGYWVVGLDGGGDRPYTALDYATPIALVVGNEGKGLRRLVRERCDFLVKIPLRGRIASLNASVAGALVMYEVVRKRS